MEKKKIISIFDKIEERRGLWGFLSLILGIILGVGGTLTTQRLIYNSPIDASVSDGSLQVGDVSDVSKSAFGKGNIVVSTENSDHVENTVVQNQNRVPFSEFAKAIARLDFETIRRYEEDKDQIQRDYHMAFEESIGKDKYVVKEYLSKIRGNDIALKWLKHVFNMGFDINSKLKLGDDTSTSLFWLAVDEKAIDVALFMLKNGASPYSWHQIGGERTKYPRMAWPVEYVVNNRHLSKIQKKKLITGLIESGAAISNVTGIREELKHLGIKLSLETNICDLECAYNDEVCNLIELFKKSYDFKYYRNSSSFFYPESYFMGVDENVYVKTKGFGYPDSKESGFN